MSVYDITGSLYIHMYGIRYDVLCSVPTLGPSGLCPTLYFYLSPTTQLSQDHEPCVYVCAKLTFVLPAIVWLQCPELPARYFSNVILETKRIHNLNPRVSQPLKHL